MTAIEEMVLNFTVTLPGTITFNREDAPTDEELEKWRDSIREKHRRECYIPKILRPLINHDTGKVTEFVAYQDVIQIKDDLAQCGFSNVEQYHQAKLNLPSDRLAKYRFECSTYGKDAVNQADAHGHHRSF